MKVESESEEAQSCPTLCDPMDCNLPGSSIHGIFQARALEWGAIAFSQATWTVTHFPLAISHVYSEVCPLIERLCVLLPLACLPLKGSQLRAQKGKENYFPPLHSQTIHRGPQILMPLLVPVLNGLPCPSPGDLPNPGIKPTFYVSCIGRQVLHH